MKFWKKNKNQCAQFWLRQFSGAPNPMQNIFDVLFGIIAPVLCLVFDPIVFQGSFIGGAYLGPIQIFAYLAISIGMIILLIWLFVPIQLNLLNGALGGVMLLGSVFALALGVILFPITLLALLVLQLAGIFGLTPFLTAFVFARNGSRAMRSVRKDTHKYALAAVMLLSMILALGIPAFLQWRASSFVTKSIQAITHGSKEKSDHAITRLKKAFWCTDSICYDQIIRAYYDWNSQEGEDAYWLANAYKEITEVDIEERLWITGTHSFFY